MCAVDTDSNVNALLMMRLELVTVDDDACVLCAILEKLQCAGVRTSPLVVRINIGIRWKYSTVEAAWFSWETIANIGIIESKTKRLIECYTTC